MIDFSIRGMGKWFQNLPRGSIGSINENRRMRAMAIKWEKDMDKALGRAKNSNKPVLLFFHNPH